MRLKIHHRTIYRYRQPVSLGSHRLMLRPRESRDLRLISNDVVVTPGAVVKWAHDVYGNAVATATFQTMTDTLVIESAAEIQLHTTAWPIFDIAASAIYYPFRYSDDDWIDLGSSGDPAVSRPRRAVAGMGTCVRGRQSDGHALSAQRSERRHLRRDPLSKPGR